MEASIFTERGLQNRNKSPRTKVLPHVINNAQTEYIEGRFIGQNIRQISDILSFAAEQNIEGIVTFLDFEKAFDSLEWEFFVKDHGNFQLWFRF